MRISDCSSDVCSSDLIDDAAATLRHHVPRGGLGEEEQRFEVGVDHRVPIFLGEIEAVGTADDAGVIDQNVETAELFHRFVHNPAHRLVRRERSDEHTSELQSIMRISYAVFCLTKKT